jgi:hypothetical protein
MMQGYRLSVPDNDSYMLRGATPHPACKLCGLVTNHKWIDPSFRLVRRQFDASYTYDGYLIVSDRFREIARTAGAQCVGLPAEPTFFGLLADEVVAFDTARRGTRFENRCERCGRYRAVAGATPVFLVDRDRSLTDLFGLMSSLVRATRSTR